MSEGYRATVRTTGWSSEGGFNSALGDNVTVFRTNMASDEPRYFVAVNEGQPSGLDDEKCTAATYVGLEEAKVLRAVFDRIVHELGGPSALVEGEEWYGRGFKSGYAAGRDGEMVASEKRLAELHRAILDLAEQV